MKKQKKVKTSKRKGSELPDLVTVMAKLVERLESLERKTDLVLSRISTPHSEVRQAPSNFRRPESAAQGSVNSGVQSSSQSRDNNRQRPMYEAVCADCRKSCEVPFRPTGERPVYCKECFARRKSGQTVQASNSVSNLQRAQAALPDSASYEKNRDKAFQSKFDRKGPKASAKKKKKR